MKAIRHIAAIVAKERHHILRDRQTLAIILVMPVAMMFLYGYALTLDLNNVRVVIEDPGNSSFGRALARDIDATAMFRTVAVRAAYGDPARDMSARDVKAVFRLPVDFARDLRNGGNPAPIRTLIDGSDQNTATIIRSTVGPMVRRSVLKQLKIHPPRPVVISSRVLYNREQKSSLYFVPGLMAIILIMISALLTSLTITREKETGTLEQIMLSPLRPWEILVGKIVPYVVLAATDGVLILVVGRVFFGVKVSGSLVLLGGATLVYIVASLSMGLIFSTVAANRQQAMLMVLPATMLPTLVLSGFIFPLRSMPVFLRAVAHIIPATYFLRVIRGIILKGVGPSSLWMPMLLLVLLGGVFLLVALRLFKAGR